MFELVLFIIFMQQNAQVRSNISNLAINNSVIPLELKSNTATYPNIFDDQHADESEEIDFDISLIMKEFDNSTKFANRINSEDFNIYDDSIPTINFTTKEIEMIELGERVFTNELESLGPTNCSNFVPEKLQIILKKVNQRLGDSYSKKVTRQFRRLLSKSHYSKSLRPAVHDCLRNATKYLNRAHPPLHNPFAPLNLRVEIGLNKLVDLSFDGTIKVKATLAVDWRDINWRWNTSTRFVA